MCEPSMKRRLQISCKGAGVLCPFVFFCLFVILSFCLAGAADVAENEGMCGAPV